MGSPTLSARAVVIGHPMAWGRESSSLTGPLRGQHVVRASDLRGGEGRGGQHVPCRTRSLKSDTAAWGGENSHSCLGS